MNNQAWDNQADLLPPREPEPLAHSIASGFCVDVCRRCGATRETGFIVATGVYWHSEWRLGDTSPVWCPGSKGGA